MYITPENKARLNAMIYRDGLEDKEIAKALSFTISFVRRYRASVEKRIEKGEITKQSILNGVAHFKVPHIVKPKVDKERVVLNEDLPNGTVESILQSAKPAIERGAPRSDPMVATPSLDKLKGLFEELAIPVMERLVEALDKGTLEMQSLSMSWDNTYTITLKEVEN